MLYAVHIMEQSKEETATTAVSDIAALPCTGASRQDSEKPSPRVPPVLSPPESPRKMSEESAEPRMSPESPLRRARRFPATPSTFHSGDHRRRESAGEETSRAKSPVSVISSISDFNGSEDSHTERRFLRHYEELESHCSGCSRNFR